MSWFAEHLHDVVTLRKDDAVDGASGRKAQLETYGDGLKTMFLKRGSGLNELQCFGWVDMLRFQQGFRRTTT